MKNTSHLTLFSEIPAGSKFRFETPNDGKVFVKTWENGASHDGGFQEVNPGVLVFPVPDRIVIAEFRLDSGNEFLAVLHPNKRWGLHSKTNEPSLEFNTLEDIVHHLGA
jgi:hypothetical protein